MTITTTIPTTITYIMRVSPLGMMESSSASSYLVSVVFSPSASVSDVVSGFVVSASVVSGFVVSASVVTGFVVSSSVVTGFVVSA